MPDVSVIVPTRDRCERLPRTLATALWQRAVDLEVVVVDDGSQDRTPELLESYPDRRVSFVRHDTPAGLSAARNAGIASARGRWVAFLDDDDLWSPDKLALQLQALAGTRGARWSAVGSVSVDPQLRITAWRRPPRPGDVRRRLLVENRIPGGGSGVVASADLLAETGGFDPALTFVEDRDLWIRFADRSPLACVDRPLLAYVVHGSNLTTTGTGYDAELALLTDKYRRQGRTIGTEVPAAAVALRRGERATAVRMLLRGAVAHRDGRSFLRAGAIAGGPGVEAGVRRLRALGMPRAWRAEATAWLELVRRAGAGAEGFADRGPPDAEPGRAVASP